MIDESEARQRILEAIPPADTVEPVPLREAVGRILGADVFARVDLPGFDNSAMDGYAVRAGEAVAGASLRVTGEQPAGDDLAWTLGPGEAIRIFTGAPIPRGADAVVMQEDARPSSDGAAVELVERVEVGEWIRRRGSDVCAGQSVAPRGTRLSAASIGLLASQGYDTVPVRPRPRLGIVTTGDELVEPGQVAPAGLRRGHLYNSNGPMLEALGLQAGADPVRWQAPDDPARLTQILAEALASCDFVAVAGGVSVGGRDFVKECLASLDVASDFWRVRVKPGKPFLFGRRGGGNPAYVFGLPGNPVSAFVTWHLFVGPALARWLGTAGLCHHGLALPRLHAVAGRRMENPGDRPHYVRARFDPADGSLVPVGMQRSDALFGLSQAESLLRLEEGQIVEPGDSVNAWRL